MQENYFTTIEDHFSKRRGNLFIMSPKDFALVEAWKNAGIPLSAVLRGIDAVFDKHSSGPWKPARVNSIRYCEQAILAECQRMKEAEVGVWWRQE